MSENENNNNSLYERVELYYKNKEFDKIISLKDAILLDKKLIIIGFLGFAYINLKEYNEAIKIYDDMLKLGSLNDNYKVLYYNNKGICYYYLKDYDNAIKDFRECLKPKYKILKRFKLTLTSSNFTYDNNNIILNDAYNGLLNCYYCKSEDLLKKELDTNYEHLSLSFMKAIWYCKIFKWDKAFEHILRAFKNNEIILPKFQFIKYIEAYIKDSDLKENLIKLNLICEELKLKLIYISSGNNDIVSHYTNINNLKHFFITEQDSFKFRMNNAVHMNDPEEGTVFTKLFSDNKNVFDFMQNLYPENNINIKSNTFLASFSKSDKEILPMWNTYANDCNGCRIDVPTKLFDDEEIITLINNDKEPIAPINNDEELCYKLNKSKYCLYKVIYLDENDKLKKDDVKKQDILNALESVLDKNNILKKDDSKMKDIIDDFVLVLDENNILKKDDDSKIQDIIDALELVLDKIYDTSKLEKEPEAYNIIRDILDQVRFLFKSDVYEYEKEYRVVKCIPESVDVSYGEPDEFIKVPKVYIELDKKMPYEELSVILGTKVDKHKEVATYLKYLGVKEVKLSKMPYK